MLLVLWQDIMQENQKITDQDRLKQAKDLCVKRKVFRGMPVEDKDGKAEFGYVSDTGFLILYKEGCCNMQDSWAMTPENAERAYFND